MRTSPEPDPFPPQAPRFDRPSLAVVVISSGDASTLKPCLAELASDCSAIRSKLLVVHAGKAPDVGALLGPKRTSLTLVTAPAEANDGDLRRIGALHAERSIVVFARDNDSERILWVQHLCRGWRSWSETGGRITWPRPSDRHRPGAPWSRPRLSIVVPVHGAGDALGSALEAIMRSDLPREL